MQSISVFLDIAKDADFRLKNADVRRTQGVCHVCNCAMFHHCRMCVTDFREDFRHFRNFLPHLPPPVSSSEKAHPK